MKRAFDFSVLFSEEEKQWERYRTYYGVEFLLERGVFCYSKDAQVWGKNLFTLILYSKHMSGFPRAERHYITVRGSGI